tara:strand:- start:18 stop:602 length:585 start_codon:yes stop_codon:yes gene_type:complete
MHYSTNNPTDIINSECNQLRDAVTQADHPYHMFSIATSFDNQPELRTVVLRAYDDTNYILSFHTDKRSPKYQEIINNSLTTSLFYDTKRRIQLRIKGNACPSNNNNILKGLWENLSKESKACYQGIIPPSGNLPNDEIINTISENNKMLDGFENFSRIDIQINEIDVLMLHHLGHKRICFTFKNNSFSSVWKAS